MIFQIRVSEVSLWLAGGARGGDASLKRVKSLIRQKVRAPAVARGGYGR